MVCYTIYMANVHKTEEEWKNLLTDTQYKVLREKHTEPPFTGEFVDSKESGIYTCAACGSVLFSSDTKFDSGSGWPSFYDVVSYGNVKLQKDISLGMERVEVVCSSCNSHLGHLFEDGPKDTTGKRYCINSCALNFKKKD